MRKTTYDVTLPRYSIHETVTSFDHLQKKTKQDKERINWAEALLNIPQIWQKTQGEGVRVAVLDTGIDTNHTDLKDAILDTYDCTGDGIDDEQGHGTHCAGIIAARQNGVGFVGVAPKTQLLIAKVLNNDGVGQMDWIVRGIDWAVEQQAHIISMSLGGPESTPKLFESIHTALTKGVYVICAAGNDGTLYTNSISYPGRYGSVITVASHDRSGNRSGFSSHGGELDVMAPGSNIWSTYKNNGYAELSGTSMATPFVSGLAALIASKHIKHGGKTPLRNNEDLKAHLLRMASHPGYHDNRRGYGPLLPFQYFQ